MQSILHHESKMRRESPIHAIVYPPSKQSLKYKLKLHNEKSNHKYFTTVEIFKLIWRYTVMKIWKFDAKKMLSVYSFNFLDCSA